MSLSANDLADHSYQQGSATAWFERVYANANRNGEAVPWAGLQPSPDVVTWLDRHNIEGNGQRALVVGCGLGDDAEELARRGYEVTAFDISPSAIAWCQQRFPNSSVAYHAADLFETPSEWHQAFDFILEYYTIQALPPAMSEQTIAAVARHAAPAGRVLVICLGRPENVTSEGPPWPLSKRMLDAFQDHGLTEVGFEAHSHQPDSPIHRFRVEYQRVD